MSTTINTTGPITTLVKFKHENADHTKRTWFHVISYNPSTTTYSSLMQEMGNKIKEGYVGPGGLGCFPMIGSFASSLSGTAFIMVKESKLTLFFERTVTRVFVEQLLKWGRGCLRRIISFSGTGLVSIRLGLRTMSDI
jgi:hypothetical protein